MIQRKPLAPEKALIRLEELCARSEHCTYELEQKLRTWGIVKDDAEAIIYSLQRRRLSTMPGLQHHLCVIVIATVATGVSASVCFCGPSASIRM